MHEHKVNMKNVLAGVGTIAIILAALWVGVFSDASTGRSVQVKKTSTPIITDYYTTGKDGSKQYNIVSGRAPFKPAPDPQGMYCFWLVSSNGGSYVGARFGEEGKKAEEDYFSSNDPGHTVTRVCVP